ncbi:hypothetical protein X801_07354, partial [Opisthorchis viverrini]
VMDDGFQTAAFSQIFADKSSTGRSSDVEYGTELGSGLVFSADFHKFDDLKNMLECNKDALKLDAMRRIIGIRKLVFAYLTRYAEEQQDVALLSVSTFQRSLKNADHKDLIIRIAELTDTMTVPSALASILWLLGEYSHRVPRIAPDVLRKMAKVFPTLESVVKLQ